MNRTGWKSGLPDAPHARCYRCGFRLAIVTLRATSDHSCARQEASLEPLTKPGPTITDGKEFGEPLRAINKFDRRSTIMAGP